MKLGTMGGPDSGDMSQGFSGDTKEVAGVQVDGKNVRVLNPKIMQQWVDEGLHVSALSGRLEETGKIPDGYRLPTEAEVAELQEDKQKKFPKLLDAAGVSGDKFNLLTDEGQGAVRSSEWRADGASFDERSEDANSTVKKEPKLQANDFLFLVKAERTPAVNR